MRRYRAWSLEDQKMYRVAHMSNMLTVGESVTVRTNEEGAVCKIERDLKEGTYILMQSTGLHDKNGVELYYDSSLLRLTGSSVICKAIKDAFDVPLFIGIKGDMEGVIVDFSRFFGEMKRDDFEIIGTIQENPELLATQTKPKGEE